jgi:hypothetical protein
MMVEMLRWHRWCSRRKRDERGILLDSLGDCRPLVSASTYENLVTVDFSCLLIDYQHTVQSHIGK